MFLLKILNLFLQYFERINSIQMKTNELVGKEEKNQYVGFFLKAGKTGNRF